MDRILEKTTPANIATVMDGIRNGPWFAALGDPLLDGEKRDAGDYLAGLDLNGLDIKPVADWQSAAAITQNPGWDPAWWDAEEREKARLSDLATRRIGETALMTTLSDVMRLSGNLHGLAAVAAARDGTADAGLIRAAAGAASQAAHYAALAHLAGEGCDHAFAAKFRLFVAGRWPLCTIGKEFYVF